MKIRILALIVIVGFSFGCKKLQELTQFEMAFDESVNVPSSLGINIPLDIPTPDITTNSDATFSGQNTSKDLINKISLKTMQLSLATPVNGDLSFLKSIEIQISANNLPDVKVAWKTDVPSNVGKTLILDASDADIKEYIKGDKFHLKVKVTTRKVIATEQKIDIHSVFFVDAKVLGI